MGLRRSEISMSPGTCRCRTRPESECERRHQRRVAPHGSAPAHLPAIFRRARAASGCRTAQACSPRTCRPPARHHPSAVLSRPRGCYWHAAGRPPRSGADRPARGADPRGHHRRRPAMTYLLLMSTAARSALSGSRLDDTLPVLSCGPGKIGCGDKVQPRQGVVDAEGDEEWLAQQDLHGEGLVERGSASTPSSCRRWSAGPVWQQACERVGETVLAGGGSSHAASARRDCGSNADPAAVSRAAYLPGRTTPISLPSASHPG